MKGRPKTATFETNAPDMDFMIVITNWITFAVRAKTPHMAIAMFRRQEPELASHIEAIALPDGTVLAHRGICGRCSHEILDREDERPVSGPHGGMHCGECGANSRMNLQRA